MVAECKVIGEGRRIRATFAPDKFNHYEVPGVAGIPNYYLTRHRNIFVDHLFVDDTDPWADIEVNEGSLLQATIFTQKVGTLPEKIRKAGCLLLLEKKLNCFKG